MSRRSRAKPERRVKRSMTICLSRWLRQWSRRLTTDDIVGQMKRRAMFSTRSITSCLVSKPRGCKISLTLSRRLCCSSADTSLHRETILFSAVVGFLSSSLASTPTTAETSHIWCIKKALATASNITWVSLLLHWLSMCVFYLWWCSVEHNRATQSPTQDLNQFSFRIQYEGGGGRDRVSTAIPFIRTSPVNLMCQELFRDTVVNRSRKLNPYYCDPLIHSNPQIRPGLCMIPLKT